MRLQELVRRADLPRLTKGLARTSGIEQASVARLAELWIDSLRGDAIARWQAAMSAGVLEPVTPVGIVAPGNLFVATWTAMLEPWLCGCEVRVRVGSGDPLAAGLLAEALDPEGLLVRRFARDDRGAWAGFLGDLQAVAVYGGDEAVAAVRAIAADAGFAGAIRDHGHKVTIATLSADELMADAARIAHDALLADGRGCMSLRAVLVQGEFDPDVGLADGGPWWRVFGEVAAGLPAGRVAPDLLAAIHLEAQRARMLGALGHDVRVVEVADAIVIIDRRPRARIDPVDIGPGARLLKIMPAAPLSAELRACLARDGVEVRDLGRLQAPPVWRDPDGHPVGAVFLRRTDRD